MALPVHVALGLLKNSKSQATPNFQVWQGNISKTKQNHNPHVGPIIFLRVMRNFDCLFFKHVEGQKQLKTETFKSHVILHDSGNSRVRIDQSRVYQCHPIPLCVTASLMGKCSVLVKKMAPTSNLPCPSSNLFGK